jgi:hypothetical protein
MYYPKNRTQTNLFTTGGLLVYKLTQKPYKGYYWKTFTGQYYSGKDSSDIPYVELEIYSKQNDNPDNFLQVLPSNYDTPTIENEESLIEYNILKPTNITFRNLPNNILIKPTSEDYEKGSFIRYFLVKINEPIYWEVNQEIYEKFINKDPKWVWELFTPFNIEWYLSKGDEIKNETSILLKEKLLGRLGLQNFLKKDYSKFII